ncbi:NAD(P)-dependent alcohol dehydrogenase [Prescottella sp. R16]|uniref:NAD(P)-dependent alcohol dehydrogenase n=1 Tax=Prescottella sp. R16 TaxID=3064529 RepID=UPI00272EBFA5|nr:NAD(P)-dependent alcohol dehydrogenase [Prescottella sp. R16]
MTTVDAYAATAPDLPLTRRTIERREPGPFDVLIEISHVGICHSDIHTARNDWGVTRYPVVPGHEIVGSVVAVGDAVTKHSVGDRVGVGCFVDSCLECASCLDGDEQYCTGPRGVTNTYGSADRYGGMTQGGYSTHIVVTEHFVVRIPDTLPSERAAPLLCAGVTMYSPLREWNVGADSRVAIIGMGGLGHVGVQIAAALGAEVTVLSHSLSKMEDGLRFGATDYRSTRDSTSLADLRGKFDLILNTVSANLDLDHYMSLLTRGGTLVELGLPEHPLAVRAFSLTHNRRSLAGSMVGGIPVTEEMLDFCANHGIGAEVEVISMDQINAAYERVLASDIRYRFVADMSTM